VLLLLAGCQVHTRVAIDVGDDGSGRVEVAVGLDEDAAARVPDLADQLEVADLVATGWEVTGPAREGDGRTWIRASKPFASVEQAGLVLDEVAGAGGPFRDLEVRRRPSVAQDRWDLTATVDLRDGLAGFSDDALRERLDGTDVGLSDDEVAAQAGRPLAEAVTFEVVASLPGRVAGNGDAVDGRSVWRPALGERLELSASGTRWQATPLLWLAAAGAALAALVVVLVRRAVTGARRRRRRRDRATVGSGA
jgi:hypothetical protein